MKFDQALAINGSGQWYRYILQIRFFLGFSDMRQPGPFEEPA